MIYIPHRASVEVSGNQHRRNKQVKSQIKLMNSVSRGSIRLPSAVNWLSKARKIVNIIDEKIMIQISGEIKLACIEAVSPMSGKS